MSRFEKFFLVVFGMSLGAVLTRGDFEDRCMLIISACLFALWKEKEDK